MVFGASFHALLKPHTQVYPCELEVLLLFCLVVFGFFLKGHCRCDVFCLCSRIRGAAVNRNALLVALLAIKLGFFI